MAVNFFEKGIKSLDSAIAEDNKKNYSEALNLYLKSFEYFIAGLKYSKNEKYNNIIRSKMREFLTRAESIKQELKKAEEEKKKKEDIPPLDEETKKLRESLSDCLIKEKPSITWKDVAGLEPAKTALEEAVILPQKFPQLFTGKRKPWKAILLYGPPGTGKSLLAKATAGITNSTFFSVSSSNLVSKWVGESEKLIRQLFQLAQESKPAIVFIDEIDSICGKRENDENDATLRIKTEFLVQMQKILDSDGVLVLAATNRPFDLDTAVRRRFEKRIYIPLPDQEARLALFRLHLGDDHNLFDASFLKELAKKTEGYSGSDISILSRDVLMAPIREAMRSTHWKRVPNPKSNNPPTVLTPCSPDDPEAIEMNLMDLHQDQLLLPSIKKEYFENALQKNRPSVSAKDLEMQERFTRMYGMPQLAQKSPEEIAKELELEKEQAKEKAEEKDLELMKWTTETTQKLDELKKTYKSEKKINSPKFSPNSKKEPVLV